jgi:hypothetical protein
VTPDHREALADAIDRDRAGFDMLRAELPSEHLDALELLHAVGSDPAAALDAEWSEARVELAQYGAQVCGLA